MRLRYLIREIVDKVAEVLTREYAPPLAPNAKGSCFPLYNDVSRVYAYMT